ncbi:MAG: hypothetical protein M1575_00610 [Patescibacteria group bacterium]|nr:hypothetical protein [Patescibacteria group bacterium]MCL5095228.1 hypothetical protein [Patescibacteria group bacterium]
MEENLTEKPPELVQPLEEKKKMSLPKFSPLIIVVFIILAGVLSGFFLSQKGANLPLLTGKAKVVKTAKMIGSTDTKTFKDQAEGILEKGGVDGEGTHKLIRNPDDLSQTAYLTSSVINLDDYLGKKVRVWGETFAGQKASWLMDVGRVELLD